MTKVRNEDCSNKREKKSFNVASKTTHFTKVLYKGTSWNDLQNRFVIKPVCVSSQIHVFLLFSGNRHLSLNSLCLCGFVKHNM